ncbi:B1 protein-like [Aethina tumida]|uniref:B1 protein-like n=1 Tax=Aethina tumida TaxID=116153 RepID=UPI00096B2D04|nr:B1 protein-like [Aethina tumida]
MKKLLLFLAAFVAFVAADIEKDGKEFFRGVHRRCQEDPKTGVPEEQVKRLYQGFWKDCPKLKIHMVCMYRGFNYIDQHGIINKDLLKSQWSTLYNKEDFQKLLKCLVQKCNTTDTVWDLARCKHDTVGSVIELETLWYDKGGNDTGRVVTCN